MPNAPKFGNWENDSNISYTEYFEDTRNIKQKGKFTNSRNPVKDPSSVLNDLHHHPHAWPRRDISKTTDLQFTRTEQICRPITSPAFQDVAWNPGEDSHKRRGIGQNVIHIEKREGKTEAGNGHTHSAHRSPLNQYIPARVTNKVESSPSRERSDASGHGLAPSTPGRSRLQIMGQKDKAVDKRSVLPKFGEWDLPNSADGEGYSGIFEKLREDKQKELDKGSTESSKSIASGVNGGHKHSIPKSSKQHIFNTAIVKGTEKIHDGHKSPTLQRKPYKCIKCGCFGLF